MLHYELVKKRGCPLYECLYECLREDILRGRLLPGTKLPSRREMCIRDSIKRAMLCKLSDADGVGCVCAFFRSSICIFFGRGAAVRGCFFCRGRG